MRLNKNVYIKTFGCSLNHSDSELMAGLLEEAGFNATLNFGSENTTNSKLSNLDDLNKENKDFNNNFDVVIINTCSVKNLAERKFFREYNKWKNTNTKIIVTGCIPQAEPKLLTDELKNVSVLGTRQLTKIVDVVNHTLSGEIIHDISTQTHKRLNLPKIRKTNIIEIMPISEGCLSQCTYCKTKYARGNLLSYSKDDIIMQFKSALAQGCKEFWITSQDNGCYGFDIYRPQKYFLPQLLNDLTAIEGDFMIRVGMANPDHIKRIKKDLIESFKNPKIFKFLHIPVQSGNNHVLKIMKRYYSVEDFEEIVEDFRKEIPQITLSTDIILGFPEETDEEFKDTIRLIQKLNPEVVNISRFWLRSGTAAEKLKQISGDVSKERGEMAKHIFQEISAANNRKWIGKHINVLINEVGKNGEFIGRNDSYKQVIIHKSKTSDNNLKIGDNVSVEIVDSGTFHILGKIGESVIQDTKA